MMKIAIVGMADFTEQIPDDYEIWIIAKYISHFERYDRAFECHDREPDSVLKMIADEPWFYVPEHLAYLYPKAQLIPVEELANKYFRSFGSTISYMLAQAIHEKPEAIVLYGVAMADEHEGQRPSAFYWLGVANGLGIKTSGLLTEEMYGTK
jgi:hypothetical protein